MEKRAQESSSSTDTKLVQRVFNEANYQVKSILDENSNKIELWKNRHEHLNSAVKSD